MLEVWFNDRMIEEFDERFATLLRMPRSAYVTETGGGRVEVRQTGGAYLPGSLDVPSTSFELTEGGDAIETFVVTPGSAPLAVGEEEALISLWEGTVAAMAEAVAKAAAEHSIELMAPGYLTVSALPLDQVSHEPHVDDDRFNPGDGVSLVATLADVAGTRCTTVPIDSDVTAPGTPLVLPGRAVDAFDAGEIPSVESEPGRIVILPQFGQLHSGPVIADPDPGVLRTLFVLRFATTPSS